MVSILAVLVLSTVPSPSRALPDVPSPSQALLQVPSPAELTADLLAQADPQAEQDLERVAPGPDPQAEQDLERDMERARRRTQAGRRARPPAPDSEYRRYGGERRGGGASREVVDADGHGKGYYLAWGIVDWVIAGSLFSASTSAWLAAGASGGFSHAYPEDEIGRDFTKAFIGTAVVTGIIGAVVSWRAGLNIGTYRGMKAQELMGL